MLAPRVSNGLLRIMLILYALIMAVPAVISVKLIVAAFVSGQYDGRFLLGLVIAFFVIFLGRFLWIAFQPTKGTN